MSRNLFSLRVATPLLALGLCVASSPAQNPFPAEQFSTGIFPQFVEVTDLDGDGNLDLVLPNKASAFISVLKGHGNGEFTQGTNIAITADAVTMALGDITGDGFIDAVTGGSTVLHIAQGLGGGLFGPATTIGAGGTPISLAIGNLNGDPFPDLIVATAIGNLSFHAGLGGGNFAPPVLMPFGFDPKTHRSMIKADFNSDFNADIAVANYGIGVTSVVFGDGTGAFPVLKNCAVGANPWALAVGDLNFDGALDIVTACRTPTDSVTVNYNNTVGGFFPGVAYPAGPDPRGVAIGDMNNDGASDIVVANYDLFDGGVSVLLSNGLPPGFGAPTKFVVGNQPFDVAIADLTGDANADVLAVNTQSYAVTLAVGDGAGNLQTSIFQPGPDAPRVLALVDMDHDGRPDAITANTAMYATSFSRGNGPSTFGPPTTFGSNGPPQNALGADVNGDSKLDLVYCVSNPAKIVVMAGDGLGGFGPLATNYPLPSFARAFVIADLDNNGKPDFAVAHSTTNNVSVLLQSLGGVYGGPVTYASGNTPSAIAVADMNADSQRDIVTGDSGSVSILLGSGTGTFGAPTSTPVTGLVNNVALGDVNLDGLPDVATSNLSSFNVALFLNSPAGLGAPTYYPIGTFNQAKAGWVAIGDVNQDGIADLVTANGFINDSNISVLLGDGIGGFSARQNFGVQYYGTSGQLSDTDLDGDLDFVTTVEPADRFSIAVNNAKRPTGVTPYGTGTFGAAGMIPLTTNSTPHINNPNFAILATQMPRNTLGVVLICDLQDLAGTDYFGINLLLYVNPAFALEYYGLDARSDAGGAGISTIVTIPNFPFLVGKSYYAQVISLEKLADGFSQTASSFSLVSSQGMTMVIQP